MHGQKKYYWIIIENDSLVAIQAINEKFKPPMQIYNLVDDIIMLTRKIDDIKYISYRRSAEEMADKIAQKTHVL